MSVDVNYSSKITTTEVLATNMTEANDATVRFNGMDTTATLNASSTPAVTKAAFFAQALTGGAATVDLTALTGANGATVDGSGLRVQLLKAQNPSTNTGAITIAIGASNGYDGFGAAFSVAVDPGAEILIRTDDAGSDIGATKKNLDLSGTGTEALTLGIIMG